MEHEGRSAGERKRFLTVFLGQLHAQVFTVFFGFLQKTVGHVMMVNIDRTGIHGSVIRSVPNIFLLMWWEFHLILALSGRRGLGLREEMAKKRCWRQFGRHNCWRRTLPGKTSLH